MGHVGDEHLGLVGVAHLVGHLDLLDAHGEHQKAGDDEKEVFHLLIGFIIFIWLRLDLIYLFNLFNLIF